MRITKAGIFLLVLIVILSIFTANFLNLITVEFEPVDENAKMSSLNLNSIPLIDDSSNHLMWFTQVSDLHLSIFQDPDRALDLFDLCDFTMRLINPSVILVTGDLTDAKKADMIGSKQFEEEWMMYKDILDTCQTTKNIPWLDIRGNHDVFDVPNDFSKRNFFHNYSMQGMKHSRSYVHKVVAGSEKYAFIGIDACPAIGLKRPFNFIGLLPDSEMEELKKLSKSALDADYIFWFGHYPTSCILSHSPGVRSVISSSKKSLAYFCGHFHAMLGFVPNMYTLQKNGFYELELSDWKDNRMFRVAAIDHGLFSFVDVRHRDWPIVLITNPKNALYQSPRREPLSAMLSSTHIRILVFSPSKVLSVQLKIDKEPLRQAIPVGGPLFVSPWKAAEFSSGLHYIHVTVVDADGREKEVQQAFSLDGTKLQYDFLARILLMLSFTALMQVLYGLAVVSCTLPYCFLRYMNKQALESKRRLPALKNTFAHRWLRRMWILSNIDTFFYPIVLYPLYISIGPWAVAEMLDGEYGLIFIWGIFVKKTYLPGSLTYGYAFLQLFLFHGPLVSFTAYYLDKRLLSRVTSIESSSKIVRTAKRSLGQLPFLVLLLSQVLMGYTFYLAYGWLAVLSGPLRLWPLALSMWVWYHSRTMPLQKMKLAARVWAQRDTGEES